MMGLRPPRLDTAQPAVAVVVRGAILGGLRQAGTAGLAAVEAERPQTPAALACLDKDTMDNKATAATAAAGVGHLKPRPAAGLAERVLARILLGLL